MFSIYLPSRKVPNLVIGCFSGVGYSQSKSMFLTFISFIPNARSFSAG